MRDDLTPLPFVRPLIEADDELLADLAAILASGRLTNDGPMVRRLEAELAGWLDVASVIAVSTGSDGLLLGASILRRTLSTRDRPPRVVAPAFTYIATVSGFVHLGFDLTFCDIDPATWTLSPDALEAAFAAGPVDVVVAVNAYGVPPDLAAIAALCQRNGARLVYDDSHGLGSSLDDVRLPVEPWLSAGSLHATKLVPAVEAGWIVASDPQVDAELRRLRNHGLATPLEESTPGFNGKLDELRARIGLHSLARIDAVLARRRTYGTRLRTHLGERCGGAYGLQRHPAGLAPNHLNLPVYCNNHGTHGLDALIAAFAREGVEARRYFHPPLHRMAAWRGPVSLPETDRLCEGLVCLPLWSRMAEDDLARVERAALRVAAVIEP